MKPLGFAGTLVFAVVASMTLVVGHLVLGPWLGGGTVLALFLLVAASIYGALLGAGATLRRRVVAGGAVLAGGLGVAALSHSIAELAVGLALVVGLVRGTTLQRSTPLRTIAVELVLGLGGLCLARWLVVPGVLGAAAGFWGYALVQSLYFLVPGERREASARSQRDPFEHACEQLSSLLDQG